MNLNKNYLHFKRWFKSMEVAIHQGQWSDEQIAYSAYKEGQKVVKNCNIPLVISSVCTCTKFRETPMINGKHICSVCNKPIVQTDL